MDLVRFIVERFSRWRSAPSPSPEAGHLRLGREGERLAAFHLKRLGLRILYRNFRGPRGGEVDLVCRDGDTLVFAEVKTRTATSFGRPADAVNAAKQRLIIRGALAWLRMLDNPEIPFRFDIVEVVVGEGAPEINVIRDAFHLPDSYVY